MDDYLTFVTVFRKLTGVDLESYKRPQMERRLTSLMTKYGYTRVTELLPALTDSSALREEFLDRVTINVTEFFRNPERWQDLTHILRDYDARNTMNVWSAACSSGEEPYSLAMLFKEELRRPYRILATDIDLQMLARAEVGNYRKSQVTHVPEQMLKKYFRPQPHDSYTLEPALKEFIQFQQHNLLSASYPGEKDLIVCRNVLIYFTDDAKVEIIRKFTQSLKPNGILFLGSTETLVQGATGLKNIAPFIYKRVS